MNQATTTCAYSVPLNRLGAAPGNNENWNFASSNCQTISQTDASSTIATTGGFTYGDIVISVMLFLIFAAVLYSFLWSSVNHVRIKQ